MKSTKLFEVICTKVDNLRNFKRLVNSTFPVVFANKHNLNPYDLLAVEVIHFLEPALYEIIRKNYKYFISYHKEYNYNTIKDIFNNDKINKEAKQFFSELFSNFSAYKELLASMFPYVKSYNGKSQLGKALSVEKEENE